MMTWNDALQRLNLRPCRNGCKPETESTRMKRLGPSWCIRCRGKGIEPWFVSEKLLEEAHKLHKAIQGQLQKVVVEREEAVEAHLDAIAKYNDLCDEKNEMVQEVKLLKRKISSLTNENQRIAKWAGDQGDPGKLTLEIKQLKDLLSTRESELLRTRRTLDGLEQRRQAIEDDYWTAQALLRAYQEEHKDCDELVKYRDQLLRLKERHMAAAFQPEEKAPALHPAFLVGAYVLTGCFVLALVAMILVVMYG